MKVVNVVGARPNFMKIAPLMEEMVRCSSIAPVLVHTGQHYDEMMSRHFFLDLGIPKPDIDLEVGSGTHASQTAAIMERFEPVLLQEEPDLVLVVGDVNSTIACALTSVKLGVPVAHVEAGLRSFDRSMPEEVNRVLTDAISDFLFTTEESANINLSKEGISESKIHFVGNVMIDTLLKHKEKAHESDALIRFGLTPHAYCLVTLHRPSNVDSPEVLEGILYALEQISKEITVLFPCHPRTQKKLHDLQYGVHSSKHDTWNPGKGFQVCDPLGYLDFLKLMTDAKLVLTDSGGIQEETTILGVPCITIRKNTERPITLTHGTNILAGSESDSIVDHFRKVLNLKASEKALPPLWDGRAAKRIVKILREAE